MMWILTHYCTFASIMNNQKPKQSSVRKATLRGLALTSVSLSTILGIQFVAQAPDEQQAIASETYPGCDTSDRAWNQVTPVGIVPSESGSDPVFDTSPVRSIAFSSDSDYLASGHIDGLVYLWNLSTYDQDRRIINNPENNQNDLSQDDITSLAFSPDGDFLVSGDSDGFVILWQVNNGTLRRIETYDNHAVGVPNIILSEGVNSAVFTQGGYLVTAGSDKYIRIWSLENERLILNSEIQSELVVKDIAVSPDEKYIAVVGIGNRNIVEIREFETGEVVNILEPYITPAYAVAFHPCQPEILAFSPNSIAPTTETQVEEANSVRIWNLEEEEEVMILRGHEDAISDLAFSPNGKILLSSSFDKTIKMWDTETGDLEMDIAPENWIRRIIAVTFDLSGQRFAIAHGEGIIRVAGLD